MMTIDYGETLTHIIPIWVLKFICLVKLTRFMFLFSSETALKNCFKIMSHVKSCLSISALSKHERLRLPHFLVTVMLLILVYPLISLTLVMSYVVTKKD